LSLNRSKGASPKRKQAGMPERALLATSRCWRRAGAGPTPPAVLTPSWRGPRVGYRGRAHGHAHTRRARALPALHARQLANRRAQARRPNFLRAPRTPSSLAFARAQLRVAPLRLSSAPAEARRCAPFSTAPPRVQAPQSPPPAPLVPSRALAGVRPFLVAGRPCSAAGDLLARIAFFPGA
jgi:hypothetical protein